REIGVAAAASEVGMGMAGAGAGAHGPGSVVHDRTGLLTVVAVMCVVYGVVVVAAGAPPHEEADDGEEEPRHVAERVEGHRGSGGKGDEDHEDDPGQDPAVPWRWGRGLVGKRRQVAEEPVEVATGRGRHGGVEAVLELDLIEATFGVVARE